MMIEWKRTVRKLLSSGCLKEINKNGRFRARFAITLMQDITVEAPEPEPLAAVLPAEP
jgi:hypothetical protein